MPPCAPPGWYGRRRREARQRWWFLRGSVSEREREKAKFRASMKWEPLAPSQDGGCTFQKSPSMWGWAGLATGVPWDTQSTMGTLPDPDVDPHVSPPPNGVRSRGWGLAETGCTLSSGLHRHRHCSKALIAFLAIFKAKPLAARPPPQSHPKAKFPLWKTA